MGKAWDGSGIANDSKVWQQCLRVLKPGGYLLAFGGTRTYHRMVCAVEDAGFEIRDSIHWVYGSGFPKSLDVGRLIDRQRGDDVRPVCRWLRQRIDSHQTHSIKSVAAAFGFTPQMVDLHWAARETHSQPSVPNWDQWVALKEMLDLSDDVDAEVLRLNNRKGTLGDAWLAREVVGVGTAGLGKNRPAHDGGYEPNYDVTAPATDAAKQWDGWGTALKPAHEPIVMARKPLCGTVAENVLRYGTGAINVDGCRVATDGVTAGRWPSNLVLTHDPDCADVCVDGCAVREMDEQSGDRPGMRSQNNLGAWTRTGGSYVGTIGNVDPGRREGFNDAGGASRFFPVFRYTAKASRKERPQVEGAASHPTVKPLDLMRWLVRLVTPPGGVVLDPFAGSGTTLEAAVLEGFDSIGIELMPEYRPLIEARLERCGILVGA
jgi:hypothetical protein